MFFKLLYEGIVQSLGQLTANKLRTFLSLLGITIGIFCIIAVLSAVDSLEDNIKGSFEKLGNDVLYITKMPWNEDPSQNYFKYLRRPNATYKELEAVKARVQNSSLAAIQVYIGSSNLKYKSSSINGAFVLAVSYDYNEIYKMEYDYGRFFTPFEFESGADKVGRCASPDGSSRCGGWPAGRTPPPCRCGAWGRGSRESRGWSADPAPP